ncbi:hypothetical protein SEA_OUTIS_84 [Gordonia phage Outis]|nr:hypothetical protein SEA_STARSTRUCK_84 [Gordonia phage StarStruck]WKW85057.1 hypothetical protein SEA_OUTIS_84 [Gordonia phage Outis]
MRIHTTLTLADLGDALREANGITARVSTDVAPNSHREGYRPHTVTPIGFERCNTHGSRTHPRAFDVILSGDASGYHNTGCYGAGNDYAATYDQWGLFLAGLFARDESVRIPQIYHNGEHFHWATGSRYRREIWTPESYHRGHRWGYSDTAATGSYTVSECRADYCAAITRRVSWGHTWQEIAG